MATQLMSSVKSAVNDTVMTGNGLANSLAHSTSMDSLNGVMVADDEVRTLFVSGLPMDAKPRELYLLFRGYKGYERSQLKITARATAPMSCGYEGSLLKATSKNGKNTSPVGFVTFSSKTNAENAKNDLQQGVRFDPDLPQTLRLEFAKSNTKVAKPKQHSGALHQQQTAYIPLTAQDFATTAFFPAGTDAWAHLAYDIPTALQQQSFALQQQLQSLQIPPHLMNPMTGLASIHGLPHPLTSGLAAISQAQLHNSVQGTYDSGFASLQASPIMATSPSQASMRPQTPSNTLFVSNLGPFCLEQELTDLFASFPGFQRLRMTKVPVTTPGGGQSLIGYVEYADVRCAMDALTRLQGFVLLSSGDRGGIRIDYTKAKLAD